MKKNSYLLTHFSNFHIKSYNLKNLLSEMNYLAGYMAYLKYETEDYVYIAKRSNLILNELNRRGIKTKYQYCDIPTTEEIKKAKKIGAM